MKQIPLSQGLFALVDDADFEELSKHKWCAYSDGNRFYAKRGIKSLIGKWTTDKMHRRILGLNDPKVHVDHINGNGLDNRRENLRACTNAENLKNQSAYKNNKLGMKGAYFHKATGKFMAQIGVNGKIIHLGLFPDLKGAAMAYDEAAKIHHGEFAKTNF